MNTPRSWTSTACLLAGLALLVGQGAQAEERIALVIGNGAYKEALLRNPPNDARAMPAVVFPSL